MGVPAHVEACPVSGEIVVQGILVLEPRLGGRTVLSVLAELRHSLGIPAFSEVKKEHTTVEVRPTVDTRMIIGKPTSTTVPISLDSRSTSRKAWTSVRTRISASRYKHRSTGRRSKRSSLAQVAPRRAAKLSFGRSMKWRVVRPCASEGTESNRRSLSVEERPQSEREQ